MPAHVPHPKNAVPWYRVMLWWDLRGPLYNVVLLVAGGASG